MAEKLLEDKEAAIKEGLREKLKSLDNDLADEVINKAINLDVNSEVEKRFDAIKRNIDSGLSIEDSIGSVKHDASVSSSKEKKNMKFATMGKDHKFKSGVAFKPEDSIAEEIYSEVSMSQSMKS
jgi:hypothetical protein